jgi:glycosyltransferase involved in cell wall biosynthesis
MNAKGKQSATEPTTTSSEPTREDPGRRFNLAFTLPPWLELPPQAYGGIESLVSSLIETLIERGHTIFMVGVGANGTTAHFRRTFEEPQWDRLGQALPEVVHAALGCRHINQLDVDLVHDHSLAGPLTAPGRKVPTVVTAHGPCVGDMASYYQAVSDYANMIAISDSQRRLAPRVSWVGTVHNAVNADDYPVRRDKDDFLLYISRMSPDKGAHLAIDAARSVGRRIVLAGKTNEPVEQEYFEAEIRHRLGSDAEFVGTADLETKKELYSKACCLVFPIRWDEPFGLVMIEAMACGTPVVALNRGSVPEVVVDGVTGFVRDDPSELTDAINMVDGIDPVACRRHVEQNFDMTAMAVGYERAYAQVCGGM